MSNTKMRLPAKNPDTQKAQRGLLWRRVLVAINEWTIGEAASYSRLRSIMQAQVDRYFGERIRIGEKALHALAAPNITYHKGFKFDEEQVFERLVLSSPYLFHKLERAGFGNLSFYPTRLGPGLPKPYLMHHIFGGTRVEQVVRAEKYLSEFLLFVAIMESIGEGGYLESRFRRVVDLSWPKWRISAQELKQHTDKICLIEAESGSDLNVSDESFELLFELDEKNKLRVYPHGVSALFVGGASATTFHCSSHSVIPSIPSSDILSRDVISSFEELINSDPTEADIQRFFEANPNFFHGIGYTAVYPQLVLGDPIRGSLVPDFFIRPRDNVFLDILEIKRPGIRLITSRRDGRRLRFSSQIREGIAQLLEYKRFFNDSENRLYFQKRYRMRVFEPRIVLLAGNSVSYEGIQYSTLEEELPPGVQLITYDGLLEITKRYIDQVVRQT